jgi:hypothetical protein
MMSQLIGGLPSQIQQILSYWRTRIEAIRSQLLGRLGGGGGIILRPTSLIGFSKPSTVRPTIRSQPIRVTAPARTSARVVAAPPAAAKVGVPGERYDMTQKILVPEERYDFTYKTRRVGTPGERYDFTY